MILAVTNGWKNKTNRNIHKPQGIKYDMKQNQITEMAMEDLRELIIKTLDKLKQFYIEERSKDEVNKKEYLTGAIDALINLKKVIQP